MLKINQGGDYKSFTIYRVSPKNMKYFIEEARKLVTDTAYMEYALKSIITTDICVRQFGTRINIDYWEGTSNFDVIMYKPKGTIKYNKYLLGGTTIQK